MTQDANFHSTVIISDIQTVPTLQAAANIQAFVAFDSEQTQDVVVSEEGRLIQ